MTAKLFTKLYALLKLQQYYSSRAGANFLFSVMAIKITILGLESNKIFRKIYLKMRKSAGQTMIL